MNKSPCPVTARLFDDQPTYLQGRDKNQEFARQSKETRSADNP